MDFSHRQKMILFKWGGGRDRTLPMFNVFSSLRPYRFVSGPEMRLKSNKLFSMRDAESQGHSLDNSRPL